MPRLRTGEIIKIRGWWHARIDYHVYDEQAGKRRRKYITRKADANTKFAARKKLEDLFKEFDGSPQSYDGASMTFAQLADFYKETYLIEPEYIDGRRVIGLRNKYDYEKRLEILRKYFSKKRVRDITYGDLEKYRLQRIRTPVIVGRNTRGTTKPGNPISRQRSIASVHRELSLLRRILNVARRNKWIAENPFELGEPLIRPGDEKPRERILRRDEEQKLLDACTGERMHLKPLLICALDTGMRRGEMLKMKWADIDFEARLIIIHSFNTKTERQRVVAMTGRLTQALEALWNVSVKNPDALVFGIKTSPKSAFNSAKKIAGITNLHFHDLRHTALTRLAQRNMSLSEVGRIGGHTQERTTYRYINADMETARRAAAMLDEFNSQDTHTKETVH